MHANEMPWRAQGDNTQAASIAIRSRSRTRWSSAWRACTGCQPANVLVGRGSDEAIDLLVRAFCRAGQDNVVIRPPTFGMYKVAARIQGAGVIEVPLLRRRVRARPAGGARGRPARQDRVPLLAEQPDRQPARRRRAARTRAARSPAARWCASTRPTSSSPAARASRRRLAEFPNLVVLRTLSKAYALAGARLGTLIASQDIVALLKRIIPPYAIPASTVEEVLALTEAPQRAMAAARIRTLLDERLAPCRG